jgi:hypothetical protein
MIAAFWADPVVVLCPLNQPKAHRNILSFLYGRPLRGAVSVSLAAAVGTVAAVYSSATPPRAPHSTPLREHESTGLVPVSVRTLPHAVTRSTQVSAKDVCQPNGRDILRNIEVRHLYPDVKPSYCRTDNDYITETGYPWRSLYCVRGTISTPHTICLIAG